MRLGICAPIESADAVRSAGWDYIEANVQTLLQGTVGDEQWTGRQRAENCSLPIGAANCLVPGGLKIVGPEVDSTALKTYMEHVTARAATVGMKVLVFGSGGARQVLEGFDRPTARRQILEFAAMAAPLAAARGVTIVLEPLARKECNIVNTVAEAMTYVREVDHPNFQCLVDSFHLWLEEEPLENVREAMEWIKHVHIAGRTTRLAPGEDGTDYRPFFDVLKKAGYEGAISVEAGGFKDFAGSGRVLECIKTQWAQA